MQAMYNSQVQQPQYYNQMYGASSLNSSTGSPYFYGYSMQAPRATFSTAPAHQITGPSYMYYPTQMEGSSAYSFSSPTSNSGTSLISPIFFLFI